MACNPNELLPGTYEVHVTILPILLPQGSNVANSDKWEHQTARNNYQDVYKVCYFRGPEGILIELAEEL